jgi:hypothetical protein
VATREELAWAAGLFDGEGSFTSLCSKTASKTPYPRATMAQKDPEVLLKLQTIVGCGAIYRYKLYMWATNSIADAMAVYNLLYPWLSTLKREQGRCMINRFNATRGMGALVTTCTHEDQV